jgi:hypothetical protein
MDSVLEVLGIFLRLFIALGVALGAYAAAAISASLFGLSLNDPVHIVAAFLAGLIYARLLVWAWHG